MDPFEGTIYSDFMKNRKPTSMNNNESPVPPNVEVSSVVAKQVSPKLPSGRTNGHLSNPKFKLKDIIHASKYPKVMKYKYGVRRGLPAGNVDGQEELKLPEVTSELRPPPPPPPPPARGLRRRPQEHKDMSLRKLKKRRKMKSSSPTTQFGLKDAITDEFKNNLLFQYIRDRKVRHIFEERRRNLITKAIRDSIKKIII